MAGSKLCVPSVLMCHIVFCMLRLKSAGSSIERWDFMLLWSLAPLINDMCDVAQRISRSVTSLEVPPGKLRWILQASLLITTVLVGGPSTG